MKSRRCIDVISLKVPKRRKRHIISSISLLIPERKPVSNSGSFTKLAHCFFFGLIYCRWFDVDIPMVCLTCGFPKPGMTWPDFWWLFYLVEMKLKSVLVKCEVYLCSAFEPYVKDCQPPTSWSIDVFFDFFPGWAAASEGMSTLMLPKVVCGLYFFSSWGPPRAKQKTKKPGNVEKNPALFVNRLR